MSWALELAWHIEQGHVSEPERARIHALTRPKDAISDEQIAAELRELTDRPDVLAYVLDLRDRLNPRKVTMSDGDLESILSETWSRVVTNAGRPLTNQVEDAAVNALRDLRDRYEERGKYATAANAPAPPDSEAVRELEQLATWIQNRARRLRAGRTADGTIGTGEAQPKSSPHDMPPDVNIPNPKQR